MCVYVYFFFFRLIIDRAARNAIMARRYVVPYIFPKFTSGMWRESRDAVTQTKCRSSINQTRSNAGARLLHVGRKVRICDRRIVFFVRIKNVRINKSYTESTVRNNWRDMPWFIRCLMKYDDEVRCAFADRKKRRQRKKETKSSLSRAFCSRTLRSSALATSTGILPAAILT